MNTGDFTELKQYIRLVEKEMESISELEIFMSESNGNSMGWLKNEYKLKQKTLLQLTDDSQEVLSKFKVKLTFVKQRWCV